jgi:hypothetical protein
VKSKYERRFLHDFRETPAVPAGHNYSHDSLFPLSILIGPLHLDSHQIGVMYVGHREGISRSEDGGVTWETRNTGLTNINIRALAISAIDSHVLYAGTNGKGLFHTNDSGMSWKPIPLVASESLS